MENENKKTPAPTESLLRAATIHHLSIERFRSIKTLSWYPRKGVNLVLGGGDVGKTSLLDAIALLLSPVNPTTLPDTDYHARKVEEGFAIEAVVSLPQQSGINNQVKQCWPWDWNGEVPVVPSGEKNEGTTGEAVYRLRVCGMPDLELLYEIVQPDGECDSFPVGLRRSIGLVRLGGDDRNDRDLRLVQGSALDRLLSDKGLRSRLASDLAEHAVKDQLREGAKKALEDLNVAFESEGLPVGLDVAINGNQGVSVAAMIGLTADRENVQLPFASWGAGTRRIAALAIARQNQGEAPITLVDEIERGLEPYRQRSLMNKLQSGKSQAFVTTHSPFAISAAGDASLWYMDHAGRIGLLDSMKTAQHRKSSPEMFLARLTIVVEGQTERGFVTSLLERAIGSSLDQHGIYVSAGGGHESTLELLEALAEGGLAFGGFADEENGKHPERWKRLSDKLGNLLFRWTTGCLERNIVGAVPEDKLEMLIIDPEGEKTGMRLRTLAVRCGSDEKDFKTIKTKAGGSLNDLVLGAALGMVPDGKESEKKEYWKHSQDWFKSEEGGRELEGKMFRLGIWPSRRPQLMPFCNAIRTAVHLPEVQDLNV